MKPQDTKAAQIRFGIELETFIPIASRVAVGGYHSGFPVESGYRGTERREAPTFGRSGKWRAERDGSITYEDGFAPCEFVSPILNGEEGIAHLREFVQFLNFIGAGVNKSCGCHVTVGVQGLRPHGDRMTNDVSGIARAVRRIVRVANRHALAIYGQTGTGRHENERYAAQVPVTGADLTNNLVLPEPDGSTYNQKAVNNVSAIGRGMVNCLKAFPENLSKSAIEFRAFAGTVNEHKVLHHVATVLGICRKAMETRVVPSFTYKKPANSEAALREMWQSLGWIDDMPGFDCAYGLFGTLYTEFPTYNRTALKMVKKFDKKFPNVKLHAHKV